MTTIQRHQSVQRPRVRGLGTGESTAIYRIVQMRLEGSNDYRHLGEERMLRLLSFDAINSLRRIALRGRDANQRNGEACDDRQPLLSQ